MCGFLCLVLGRDCWRAVYLLGLGGAICTVLCMDHGDGAWARSLGQVGKTEPAWHNMVWRRARYGRRPLWKEDWLARVRYDTPWDGAGLDWRGWLVRRPGFRLLLFRFTLLGIGIPGFRHAYSFIPRLTSLFLWRVA